jgi:hypothetical protein
MWSNFMYYVDIFIEKLRKRKKTYEILGFYDV